MTRIAIYVDGEIALHELATVLRNNGYHLHSDGYGRTVVDRVPAWLRKDREQEETNVVQMKRRAKR